MTEAVPAESSDDFCEECGYEPQLEGGSSYQWASRLANPKIGRFFG